jgi:starch phosphorylase
VLKDFHDIWPEKFQNKTNGVTPRRFIMLSNPGLADLLTETLGEGWGKDLYRLREIERYADDAAFQARWRAVKLDRKNNLARFVETKLGIQLDPASLFDVQVKRIHEYKRQLLNLLHIITLYNRIKRNPGSEIQPRSFIFGGKAAPGYHMAKLIIKLINSVAEVVNRDHDVAGRLKVVFIPDFNVKVAHHVYPAANLSEQISTAGKEASGTGNMKFSMNGALTIGTLDGANVEIREEVGAENFFLFGLTAAEVERVKAEHYRPWEIYQRQEELRGVLDLINNGMFSHGDGSLFRPIIDHLLSHDEYLLLADFASYIACQDAVSRTYADERAWTRMSILNVARMGKFSSDRTIAEYCRDIWKVEPVSVKVAD